MDKHDNNILHQDSVEDDSNLTFPLATVDDLANFNSFTEAQFNKRICTVFINLVSLADDRYTNMDIENFFKHAVLKHSQARAVTRDVQRQYLPRKRKYRFIEN